MSHQVDKNKHYKHKDVVFIITPYRIIEASGEKKWKAKAIIILPSNGAEIHRPISIDTHFKDKESAIRASKRIAVKYISSNIKL